MWLLFLPGPLIPTLPYLMMGTVGLLLAIPERIVFASPVVGVFAFLLGLGVNFALLFGAAYVRHRAHSPARSFFLEFHAVLRVRTPERAAYVRLLVLGYASISVCLFVELTTLIGSPLPRDLTAIALACGLALAALFCFFSGAIDEPR